MSEKTKEEIQRREGLNRLPGGNPFFGPARQVFGAKIRGGSGEIKVEKNAPAKPDRGEASGG